MRKIIAAYLLSWLLLALPCSAAKQQGVQMIVVGAAAPASVVNNIAYIGDYGCVAAAASCTANVVAAVPAGALIIVAIGAENFGGLFTVSAGDNVNGASSYTSCGAFGGAGSGEANCLYFVNSASASAGAMTVTFSVANGGSLDMAGSVVIYSGAKTSSVIDVAAGANNSNSCPNVTTTNAADLILGMYVTTGGSLGAVTVSSPYVLRQSNILNNAFGEQIVTATNTYTGAVFSGGSGSWCMTSTWKSL